MAHCPYCGINVKEDELFCVKCGKKLPEDMYNRTHGNKKFNRYWLLPIGVSIIFILSAGIYYFILQSMDVQARTLYEQGEEKALEGDFTEAEKLFQEAVDHKSNFPQAVTSRDFTQIAIQNETLFEQADEELDGGNFQKALNLIKNAENDLNNYNGTAVTTLIDKLTKKRTEINLTQLKDKLDQDPSIDEMKTLLWEADSINDDEAKQITDDIRDQIIDYTFSKANEKLSANQFSDAKKYVDDGLKYAPDSEKLQSLETTIDKEKVAFETEQQERIEQAITTAQEEQELNETDAIEVTSISVDNDKGKATVKGEVKSVATIPINSISIDYALVTKDDDEVLTNDVYVFPDTLYPGEKGKFEFTHYDIEEKGKIKTDVKKIKWYTE
ncbi:MAG TPA: zinc ribbon domain-containing protein [Virgibacillus sp.]|nr:zinc ribbon domain-containing protein [Virgibacillus sp.]